MSAKQRKALDLTKYGGGVEQVNVILSKAENFVPDLDLTLVDFEKQVRSDRKISTEFRESIRENGIRDPIVVQPKGDGRYRLIAGERRVSTSLEEGRTKGPALIERDLSEFEIRKLQVSENHDRENLSAYDVARGVAEDIEKYGMEAAMQIWNVRSQGWMSKRMQAKSYGAITQEVMKGGYTNDFEVLGSLNQIENLDSLNAGIYAARFAEGNPPSREELRLKVASIKEHLRNQEQFEKQQKKEKKEINKQQKTTKSVPAVPKVEKLDNEKAVRHEQRIDNVASTVATSSVLEEGTKVVLDAQDNQSIQAATSLNYCRNDLFEGGQAAENNLTVIQNNMLTLGFKPEEAEWVLWTSFVASVAPILSALGKDRAAGYLKRLLVKDNGVSGIDEPLTLLKSLHGGIDGTEQTTTPKMPEGWRF